MTKHHPVHIRSNIIVDLSHVEKRILNFYKQESETIWGGYS